MNQTGHRPKQPPWERTPLYEPEAFSDAGPTAEERERLGNDRGPHERARRSVTVQVRLARSCAGWERRPTDGEFYDAVRAAAPTSRQKSIIHAFGSEATWRELISAWAEEAYTLRQIAAALHRAGAERCSAAYYLNLWAERPPRIDG